ncbi:MAG: hypothetical protein IT423_15645 [Pirellulaceae bacterium]|nr:hypothetical protein [Pirellulaceae bacterium]
MAISGISVGSESASNRYSRTDHRQAAQEQLQNVFTAVLNQVGREGYASADPLADRADLPKHIGDSWHQWFDQVGSTRYHFQAGHDSPSVQAGKSAEEVRQDYEAILLDAYSKGGYANPIQYVQTLTRDQLKTVQQVHHLAEPIHTASLSTEASLNLLLPPGAQVDANHDGLTAVGAGMLIGFPNSNTPADVRDAWEAAIENVPERDRLTYELQMMMPLVTANLKVDENGQFVRSVQPNDVDWTNPMNSANYSYAKAADEWLEYLDYFKYQMPTEQHTRDKAFWTSFRAHLNSSSDIT